MKKVNLEKFNFNTTISNDKLITLNDHVAKDLNDDETFQYFYDILLNSTN